jgi:hypothetical protein
MSEQQNAKYWVAGILTYIENPPMGNHEAIYS